MNILTNNKMLNANPRTDPKFFPIKKPHYQKIAQLAQQFSLLVYDEPIKIHFSQQLKRKKLLSYNVYAYF